MGCDIHAFIEVKTDGKWELYRALSLQRSYNLFTRMAGVRDRNANVMPIALPRGLPDDVSRLVRLSREHWGSDGHSDSHLNGAELDEIISELMKEQFDFGQHGFGYLEGNGFSQDLPEWIEETRCVFWFDN